MPYANRAFWIVSFFCLCLSAQGQTAKGQSARAYSQLIIFGDSLSDTGNAAQYIDLPPPYYQNRISNGPLAVDHLAQHLGLSAAKSGHIIGSINGTNFAVGGANTYGDDPQDLNAQVNAYLNHAQNQASSNALYLIAIGGNDIRSIRKDSTAAAATKISLFAAEIEFNAQRLLSSGARSLLIANVPDIGRIPETLADGSDVKASLYSRQLNQALVQAIASLQSRYSAEIILFDFYSAFNTILAQASQHGFSHTTIGCYEFPVSYHADCSRNNFEQFVFFDSIHPSGKAHVLLGQALINALASDSVNTAPSIAPILMLLLD